MAKLLDAATSTVTGSSVPRASGLTSVFAYGSTSSGSGSATIPVEVSNDGVYWVVAGTFSLTLATTITTGTNTDGFTINGGWQYIRARVTAISGTGAAVTVTV